MKRTVLISLLVVATSLAMVASAMADIVNSRHNLSIGGSYQYKSSNEGEICVFCHTPHKPAQAIPLWNRTVNDASAYQLYTASATLSSATKKADLTGGISLKCLSCHDGTIGLGAGVFNPAQNQTITMANMNTNGGTIGAIGARYANFGQNITNSHPVGMDYNAVVADDDYFTAATGSQVTIAGNTAAPIQLFARTGSAKLYVECASCHNPHGVDGAEKFLRRSNRSSLLCLTCHTK